ncbi:hypothetical protein ACK8P5_25725 (plasmid) [Paenibacillus sp. EC2-1]|uniref:beta-xylosidase family glycoside hydrolase n=1 Tax=Paenibacillus sp. EC2-1 TaxID=3388665 RepID=UPI003BEEBC81
MSLLNRISSGFVFKDEFATDTLNAVWQASPSNDARFSLTERSGVLRLKHGDPDLFILMNSPRFDFVFEIDTDYDPVRASDQGGIVAFRDQETRIEMLEYYDPIKGTSMKFNNLRMIRRSDLFEGYGSNDGGKTWELIGVSYLSAPKIGMVLHGVQEGQSDTMDVLEARMYRDTTIQIGNLSEGLVIKLLNDKGVEIGTQTCKTDEDYVKIDVSKQTFPLAGSVRLYDTTGMMIADTGVISDMWGGDVFWYGIKLDIEIDGTLLRQDREFQLGSMQSGIIERKLVIINNNDIPVYNIRAAIAAYSDYKGWEWADITVETYGQPGAYKDTAYIGTMQPKERITLWMKVTKQPQQQIASLSDYKFRVTFGSG